LTHLKILNINIFQKISSTILLDKNKKIHRRTFYQKFENGGEIQDGGLVVHFSKNCHNSTVEYFFVFSTGLFLEKFNLTKKKLI
jgi:hypothetical protein